MATLISWTLSLESCKELPRLHTTNINRSIERKWFHTKATSRQYPTKTIMDADYTDDLALLANTPVQAKSLQHSLE